jgi:hypothetical protein
MLAQYLKKDWAVVVGHTRAGADLVLMQQYLAWYTVKHRTLLVDRMATGSTIRGEAFKFAQEYEVPAVLPLLFINGDLVGDLRRVRSLDVNAKLKDVLHFGFEWPDLHTNDTRAGPCGRVGPLRPSSRDDELFLGQYRGAPVQGAVAALPKFSPGSLE